MRFEGKKTLETGMQRFCEGWVSWKIRSSLIVVFLFFVLNHNNNRENFVLNILLKRELFGKDIITQGEIIIFASNETIIFAC